jgi:paraquat-inducible protein A
MKKKNTAVLISIIFLFLGFILNSILIETSSVYKKAKEDLAESLSYKNRFLDKEEWQQVEGGLNNIDYNSSGLKIILPFGSSTTQKKTYEAQVKKIESAENDIQSKVIYVLLLILAYLLVMLGIYVRAKPPFLILIATISVSIVCLHAGLFTPMLEIGAVERDFNLGDIPIQKEVMGFSIDVTVQKKFEGDIYFYYQSKSIADLITLLFHQNNFLVGFCILIFSVIFPIIKTFLMCFFVFKPEIIKEKWFKGFVLNLSKWSMADVFVVAMFLGFLAFENLQAGVDTYSNISIGLYFFLSYCILSISSSMLAKLPTEEFFQEDH